LPKNNETTTNNATEYSANKNNNNKLTSNYSNHSTETVKIIPVIEENFDLSKKTIVQETKIEKRLATKTEKIEVPITYEEVYVNDKKLRLYDKEEQEEGIVSKLKDTITHGISAADENIEYHFTSSSSDSSPAPSSSDPSANNSKSQNQYQNANYNKGELVPLIEGQEKNETEKVVPIWGEEIVVSKRRVKLGEIVIRKRRITESKKIDVDIRKEKVIREHPDGSKEELTSQAS
jgi:stress response protein YsnF